MLLIITQVHIYAGSDETHHSFLGAHRNESDMSGDFERMDKASGMAEDLSETFMTMEYRKVKRLTSGKYREVHCLLSKLLLVYF